MTDHPSQRSRSHDEDRNAEQSDEAEQAQTVAEEALDRATAAFGLEDSEKVSTGDESDDVQDLLDHMKQMDSSGRIDMSAFEGEDNHDDNVDRLGPRGKVDDLRGDGT